MQPGDLVLDVGAGHGAVTSHLVKAGVQVVAIELHDGRASALRDRFEAGSVKVVSADPRDLRLPRRPFRVVANPPFAVTTALIRRLLTPGSHLIQADLVVPAHVAARWMSANAPGARRWNKSFSASVVRRLPRRAFHPPATQPTVVLRFEIQASLRRKFSAHRCAGPARRGRPRPRAPSPALGDRPACPANAVGGAGPFAVREGRQSLGRVGSFGCHWRCQPVTIARSRTAWAARSWVPAEFKLLIADTANPRFCAISAIRPPTRAIDRSEAVGRFPGRGNSDPWPKN